jgi:AcrR family transcriptional regulator
MDDPDAQPAVRRRRKEARPAEIIEAGLAEFAEHGFEGARLDRVAHRAGVAKGTIYLYFDGKEALFEAALTARLGTAFDEIGSLADAWPGSMADLLRQFIPRIYQEMFENDLHVLMRIIIAEGERFPHISEAYYRQTVAKGRALLETVVRTGVARGEFRDDAAAKLPIILAAPAVMAAVWRMTFDRFAPIPPQDFLAAHLDLILHGIKRS